MDLSNNLYQIESDIKHYRYCVGTQCDKATFKAVEKELIGFFMSQLENRIFVAKIFSFQSEHQFKTYLQNCLKSFGKGAEDKSIREIETKTTGNNTAAQSQRFAQLRARFNKN